MNPYLEAAIEVLADYVVALNEFMRKERTIFGTFVDPVAQVFAKIGLVCCSFSGALTIILGAILMVFADSEARLRALAAFHLLLLIYWIIVGVRAQILIDDERLRDRERRRNQ